VSKFNCVDFSDQLFQRYFNTTLLDEFSKQGKPLKIYSDPLEPCFGPRTDMNNCWQWGVDKAAVWMYYRKGIFSLLCQMFVIEKLPSTFAVEIVNIMALVACQSSLWKNACVASWGLSSGALALLDLAKAHFIPASISLAHIGFVSILLTAAPLTTPWGGWFIVIYAAISSVLWYNYPGNESDNFEDVFGEL
jgi:hypothetical protein